MREIVHVQVGGCGNALGLNFFDQLSLEHGVDTTGSHDCNQEDGQLEGLGVYFKETRDGRYSPRTVCTDLDYHFMATIQGSRNGATYCCADFSSGSSSASHNFAKGQFSEGFDIVDSVVDIARRQAEACERLQGFQLSHGLGGGTGSGLGTLVLERLLEEYPDRTMMAWSVLPRTDVVVEPYNACFAIQRLVEHADMVVAFDNEDVTDLVGGFNRPITMEELNQPITKAKSGLTSAFRYSHLCQSSSDMRKLTAQMVGGGRLTRFVAPGISPPVLPPGGEMPAAGEAVESVVEQQLMWPLLNGRGLLCCAPPRAFECGAGAVGCNLGSRDRLSAIRAATIAFRGVVVSSLEVDNLVRVALSSPAFLPGGGLFVNKQKATDAMPSSVACCNTSAMQHVMREYAQRFQSMYQRKAFVQWYTGEGMDQMEFEDAYESVSSIAEAYEGMSPITNKPTKSATTNH
jgi:tubulin beta